MPDLSLFCTAPVASFRVPQAREYLETLPCPPPSTVYGALLSLVGEMQRGRHAGALITLALLGSPERSVVLRTVWRVKDLGLPPGSAANKRPDFQELLSDVRLAVWLRDGTDEQRPTLAERVAAAIAAPASVRRFGGLALGESTHLIDELRLLRPADGERGRFLVPDAAGPLTLPLWPDHVGSAGTTWLQCRLEERSILDEPLDDCWITVAPAGT